MNEKTIHHSVILATLASSIWICAPASASGEESPIDLKLAAQYFREATDLFEREAGKTWNHTLLGPMMFVDQGTRIVVANQADDADSFKREGEVYVGIWPENRGLGNTPVEWAGEQWTMVMWPLPQDKPGRLRLIAHEAWHRIQKEIGFPTYSIGNSHLDSRDGRIWQRLEWRALRAAVMASGDDRKRAASDALAFRAYRRSLFPGAKESEAGFEMHEGLAEYTGIRVSCGDTASMTMPVVIALYYGDHSDSLMGSFAYVSGPAYGYLLDAYAPDWREGLKHTQDLGDILAATLGESQPESLKAFVNERAVAYDGEALIAAENDRHEKLVRRQAELRRRFIDGPVLVLPFKKMNIEYNPSAIEPLGDAGAVYGTLKVADVWGILQVDGGALRKADWSGVIVPAPKDVKARPLAGEGWTLKLSEGWELTPGEREGDFTVSPKE